MDAVVQEVAIGVRRSRGVGLTTLAPVGGGVVVFVLGPGALAARCMSAGEPVARRPLRRPVVRRATDGSSDPNSHGTDKLKPVREDRWPW